MNARRAATLALLLCAALVALAATGCSASTGSTTGAKGGMAPEQTAVTASSGMATTTSSASSDMSAMKCGPCAAKGNVPAVPGSVKVVDGVQVVEIGIKNDTYDPNTFTAKSGMPIKVVFTGSATKCLAKPTFAKINKSVTIDAGSGTIELGVLPAGTYELTCGMGSHGGNLVVE